MTLETGDRIFEAHILSPEDFIVNKLARRDRSARDEGDVVGVMKSSSDKMDWKYFTKRAKSREGVGLNSRIRSKDRRETREISGEITSAINRSDESQLGTRNYFL